MEPYWRSRESHSSLLQDSSGSALAPKMGHLGALSERAGRSCKLHSGCRGLCLLLMGSLHLIVYTRKRKPPHFRKEERENTKKTWNDIYGLLNTQAHGEVRKGKEAIQ